MADIGSLIVKIGADASDLQREFDKVASAGKNLGDRVAAAGKLAGTAILAVTSAAVANTLAIAAQVEETDHLSQKTGIAVQTLQGWSVAMAENGFQAQSLATGMRTLSKEILEAQNPASAAAGAFEDMGIQITELGSTERTIRAVADRFKDMPDGPEKAALAVTLFGKSGLDLIPILNRGAAALDESRQAAERFGLVLSKDQVSAMNAVDDASDRLGSALKGLQTQFAVTFAPSITFFLQRMTESVAALTQTVLHLNGAMAETGKIHPQEQIGRDIVARTQEAVKEEEAFNGALQERLGERIKVLGLEQQRHIQIVGKAQEALGKTQLQIIQREQAARNAAFAQHVEEQDRLQRLAEGLGEGRLRTSGAFVESIEHKEEAVRNLLALMPELNRDDALMTASDQEAKGLKIVQDSIAAYQHRNDELQNAVTITAAVDEAQQAMYQSEKAAFGASDAARQTRFAKIEAEAELQRRLIDETIFNEEKKAVAIDALENQTEARRRQAIQQFPSFFEQQMLALVNSNAFSMGQIVTTWTNGIANMIVKGGSLKAVWEQTQIAIIQGLLNTGVQMVANAALMAAANQAAAVASASAWTGAITTVLGEIALLGGAVKAFFVETIWPMVVTFATAIVGVLEAIAAALGLSTIFGNVGGVIAAGVLLAAVAGIVAALAAGAFDKGGIVTGPTVGLIGEAGPEAAIPLNDRGAAFMQKAFGLGGGEHTTNIYLDGALIASKVDQRIRRRASLEGAFT